ncbi:MAG: alpha/beta hydrolase, partial [Nocardioidaceae bacterium]|nr:alpha/beta hydrolase [Nocardioidaceae bacterium]
MQVRTETLATPDVDLVYDVREPSEDAAGRPPLLMAGHPMDAGGFTTLAAFFPDRAVVSYDPRGLGRSVRKDGRDERTPQMHAADLHALIAALGTGPVDVFATSGGAVNALALVAKSPEDVHTLVAHEPPLLAILPDAERALAAEREVQAAYHRHGFGAGMAGFIALTSWEGELTDEYSAQPDPDPAMFGLPTEDDG